MPLVRLEDPRPLAYHACSRGGQGSGGVASLPPFGTDVTASKMVDGLMTSGSYENSFLDLLGTSCIFSILCEPFDSYTVSSPLFGSIRSSARPGASWVPWDPEQWEGSARIHLLVFDRLSRECVHASPCSAGSKQVVCLVDKV